MRTTRPRAAMALAAAAAAIALAGCGSTAATSTSTATPAPGNVAACKAAMVRDYEYALAHPDASPATRPAACKGVPGATLNRLAAEIMAGDTATATP